jgi:hypothetical protein
VLGRQLLHGLPRLVCLLFRNTDPVFVVTAGVAVGDHLLHLIGQCIYVWNTERIFIEARQHWDQVCILFCCICSDSYNRTNLNLDSSGQRTSKSA